MADIFRGTTALVTGASRGLGAAFADLLAARGTNLVLVARGAEGLEAVAARARQLGVNVTTIPADLAGRETPRDIVTRLEAAGITVDHLINNAGLGGQGRFQDLSPETVLATIDVNARAVTELASRLLPGMLARRRGGMLNVASTSAWQGLIWLPVYSGTKAYVLTWSEAVWGALRGTGVRCCCLSPGPVDTPYFEANQFTSYPPRWMMQSPRTVAGYGIRAYERDDCHAISFLPFRLLAWSTRLAPRALAVRLGAWYARKAPN
jgi:uncharacterized protein